MNSHDVERLSTLCKRGFDARIYGHEERVVAVCSSAVESQSVEKVTLHYSAAAAWLQLQQAGDTESIGAGFSADVARALRVVVRLMPVLDTTSCQLTCMSAQRACKYSCSPTATTHACHPLLLPSHDTYV